MKISFCIMMMAMTLTLISCKKKAVTTDSAQPTSDAPQSHYLQPSPQAEDTLLWYAKSPCFGGCPTFSFIITMSGDVRYSGKQHVEKIGEFSGKWSATELNALESEMKKIQFYQFKKNYDDSRVTDLPSMYIGYTQGLNLHKIKCRYQYPSELKQLSKWLDEQIAQTEFTKNEKIEKQ